jgi:hypothetical protein
MKLLLELEQNIRHQLLNNIIMDENRKFYE